MDLDSGVLTRLTRGGNNQYPEWSQDDQYVYFRRMQGESNVGTIWRRKADASEPAELVLAPAEGKSGVFHPALTSEGSTLVFTHDPGESNTEVHRIAMSDDLPLDLGDARRLTDAQEAVFDVDLSPDDRYIVYRTAGALLVTSIEGQGEIEVTPDGFEPVWSPDGAWIYFVRSGASEVYRIPVTTNPAFQVLGPEEQVFSTRTHLHLGLSADETPLVSSPEVSGADNESKIWVVLNLGTEAEHIAPREH